MELTETQRLLINGLIAFKARRGIIVHICLLLEEEQQQIEMIQYMVDHQNATGEELLQQAKKMAEADAAAATETDRARKLEDLARELEDERKRSKALESVNRRLREQMKATPPGTADPASLRRAAKQLSEEYGGALRQKDIAEALQKIWRLRKGLFICFERSDQRPIERENGNQRRQACNGVTNHGNTVFLFHFLSPFIVFHKIIMLMPVRRRNIRMDRALEAPMSYWLKASL